MLTGMPACSSYELQPLLCEQNFTLSRSAKRIDRGLFRQYVKQVQSSRTQKLLWHYTARPEQAAKRAVVASHHKKYVCMCPNPYAKLMKG